MTKIKYLVEILRPYNATTAVLAFLIGYFYHFEQVSLNFYLGILAVVLVHSYATVNNDIEDFEIDKINSPEKILTSGKISLYEARQLSQGLILASLAVGGFGYPIVTCYVLFMLFVAWLYNSLPLRFSRKPITSIVIMASMYSWIPMSFGRLINDWYIEKDFFILLVVWCLLRASIAILKDIKDVEGDKAHGKRTFYLTFGKGFTVVTSICLAIASLAYLIWVVRSSQIVLILLTTFALRSIYLRLRIFKLSEVKAAIKFRKIFFEQNYFDIIFFLWLIF